MTTFSKAHKYYFLDIEINPTSYINRRRKKDNPFKLPYQSRHPYKDQIKLEVGQSSNVDTTSSKGKDILFLDVYRDAQDTTEPDYEEKCLEIMEEAYLQENQSSDEFNDYDSDNSPKEPWS